MAKDIVSNFRSRLWSSGHAGRDLELTGEAVSPEG
jgi:hypothetical protein